MRREKQRYSTSLSKYVRELKDQSIDYMLEWTIIARAQSHILADLGFEVLKPKYPGGGGSTPPPSPAICLKENYCIMFQPEGSTLNSIYELYNTCRHRPKLLLGKS